MFSLSFSRGISVFPGFFFEIPVNFIIIGYLLFACNGELINCKIVIDILEGRNRQGCDFHTTTGARRPNCGGGGKPEKLRPRGVGPRRGGGAFSRGNSVGYRQNFVSIGCKKMVINILEGQTLQRWEGRRGSTVGGPKAATSTSSSKNSDSSKPQQEHKQQEKQQQAAESGAAQTAQTTTQKQRWPRGVGPEGGGRGRLPVEISFRLCFEAFFLFLIQAKFAIIGR